VKVVSFVMPKQWRTWGADAVKRNKKANGRILQGKIWKAYPEVA